MGFGDSHRCLFRVMQLPRLLLWTGRCSVSVYVWVRRRVSGKEGGARTDASPFLAAIMEPIMSGTDVPTASTRTPITMALTPKIHAAPVASAT